MCFNPCVYLRSRARGFSNQDFSTKGVGEGVCVCVNKHNRKICSKSESIHNSCMIKNSFDNPLVLTSDKNFRHKTSKLRKCK